MTTAEGVCGLVGDRERGGGKRERVRERMRKSEREGELEEGERRG